MSAAKLPAQDDQGLVELAAPMEVRNEGSRRLVGVGAKFSVAGLVILMAVPRLIAAILGVVDGRKADAKGRADLGDWLVKCGILPEGTIDTPPAAE